jgi:hypothetical protein
MTALGVSAAAAGSAHEEVALATWHIHGLAIRANDQISTRRRAGHRHAPTRSHLAYVIWCGTAPSGCFRARRSGKAQSATDRGRACVLWHEGLRLEAEAGIRASWTESHLPLRHSAGISPDFPSFSVASMELFEVETALSVAAAGWRPVGRGSPRRPAHQRRSSRAPGRRPGQWWPAWPA